MANAFLQTMQQQHKAIGHFIELLKQEQALLRKSPIIYKELAELTKLKGKQAKLLEKLDKSRQQIQQKLGYAPSRSGAEQLCEKLGVLPQWQRFLALVDEAHTQNRINGMVIANHQDLNARLLTFLKHSSDNALYDPAGQRRRMGNQTLDSRA